MSLSIHSTCDVRKLPTADPNLLPFHIAHTGPAPVSTYFLTQPAKEAVGAPEGTRTLANGASSTSVPAAATSDAPAVSDGPSTTDGLLTTNAPSATDALSASDASAPALLTATTSSADPVASTSSPPHPSKRLVSSFRGRTVHGLRVDVPPGYLGVVLRADGQPATSRARDTRPQKRARRGATDEENGGHDAMLQDNALLTDDATDDNRPSKILNPASQFASFTVWGADIPVDEGRDDYIRALTEWTALAGEIHRMD